MAVPVTPEPSCAVAVTLTAPSALAVKSPLLLIVAMLSSLTDQSTFLLLASDGVIVAIISKLPPLVAIVVASPVPFTVIALTSVSSKGCSATVTLAVAVLPLLEVAVIVAVPSFTAVTTPSTTVATLASLVAQVTVLLVALDGSIVTVSCVVSNFPSYTANSTVSGVMLRLVTATVEGVLLLPPPPLLVLGLVTVAGAVVKVEFLAWVPLACVIVPSPLTSTLELRTISFTLLSLARSILTSCKPLATLTSPIVVSPWVATFTSSALMVTLLNSPLRMISSPLALAAITTCMPSALVATILTAPVAVLSTITSLYSPPLIWILSIPPPRI